MRLSTKGHYGLRAMVVLALKYRDGPVPLREIADEENISFQYLEQIFPSLRRARLVRSIRGAKGGYILGKDPAEIKVGDIIRTLEGTLAPAECVIEGEEGVECSRSESCLARNVWERLYERINEVLDDISLADLINWQD
ncbi:MAG: RrF2 family transcriptional regulator [Dethiobacteria bacterium]|jgi:Rrf2 family cysteine metabolism transcriptional repressor|nr:RrF2 family transcriptional regulator [Bacillota bacterium]